MTRSNEEPSRELSILGYPILAWLIFFVAAPLVLVVILSFLSRGEYGGIEWHLTFDNYRRVFQPIYLNIFGRSLELSTVTALLCLLIAYPVAWAMASAAPKARTFYVIALAIPFMTNLIIRVYAIKIFVGMDGPLQWMLHCLHIPFDPYALTQNTVLVFYGMVTSYLPFMVFPLYAALEKFDFLLVEAAQDLGASNFKILFGVIVPNTRVAALNSFTLVFIPCLGEFVIPDLLGGAKSMLAGNLITEQFLKVRDWPFGAALSVILIVLLLGAPLVLRKIFLGSIRGVTA